jgi:hypothetical protein
MTTTVVYRANRAGIDHLLYDRSGPVQLFVANTGRKIEGNARRRVGVKSGETKASIGSRLTPGRPKGYNLEVFATSKVALMHHDGTRAHIIRPRNAKVLRFTVGGAVVFAQEVHHPGTKPNRFLLDAMKDEGLQPRRMGG